MLTIREAKKRWSEHTRHVISDHLRKRLKGKVWKKFNGRVFLVFPEVREFCFEFKKDSQGNISATSLSWEKMQDAVSFWGLLEVLNTVLEWLDMPDVIDGQRDTVKNVIKAAITLAEGR